MLLSTGSVWNSKESKLLEKKEAKRLLNSLGIRTTLVQICFVDPLLFS